MTEVTNIRYMLSRANSGPWFKEAAERLRRHVAEKGGRIESQSLQLVHHTFSGLRVGLAEATGLLAAAGCHRDKSSGDHIVQGAASRVKAVSETVYAKATQKVSAKFQAAPAPAEPYWPKGLERAPVPMAQRREEREAREAQAAAKAARAEIAKRRDITARKRAEAARALGATMTADEIETLCVLREAKLRRETDINEVFSYRGTEGLRDVLDSLKERGLIREENRSLPRLTRRGTVLVKGLGDGMVSLAVRAYLATALANRIGRIGLGAPDPKAAETALEHVMGSYRPPVSFGNADPASLDRAVLGILSDGQWWSPADIAIECGVDIRDVMESGSRLQACDVIFMSSAASRFRLWLKKPDLALKARMAEAILWFVAERMFPFAPNDAVRICRLAGATSIEARSHRYIQDMAERGHVRVEEETGFVHMTSAGMGFVTRARHMARKSGRLAKAAEQADAAFERHAAWQGHGEAGTVLERFGIRASGRPFPARDHSDPSVAWSFPPLPGDARLFTATDASAAVRKLPKQASEVLNLLSGTQLSLDGLVLSLQISEHAAAEQMELLVAGGFAKDVSPGAEQRSLSWKDFLERAASRLEASRSIEKAVRTTARDAGQEFIDLAVRALKLRGYGVRNIQDAPQRVETVTLDREGSVSALEEPATFTLEACISILRGEPATSAEIARWTGATVKEVEAALAVLRQRGVAGRFTAGRKYVNFAVPDRNERTERRKLQRQRFRKGARRLMRQLLA